jgi:predicted dehydrogenase
VTGQTTKIAIVGCGYVFDHYMTTVGAHPELEILGVYDIDGERAAKVAKYYGLPEYPTFEALPRTRPSSWSSTSQTSRATTR